MSVSVHSSSKPTLWGNNFSPATVTRNLAHHLLHDDVWVAVPTNRISGLLSDKRFKNCFETVPAHHEHCGTKYRCARLEYETEVFGIPPTRPAHLRPVYGYLSNTVNTVAEIIYGGFHFKLAQSVKNRSTVTFGDSLQDCLVPIEIHPFSTVTAPELVSGVVGTSNDTDVWAFVESPASVQPGGKLGANIDSLLEQFTCLTGDNVRGRFPYTEVQVNGGVTFNDVVSVAVSRENKTDREWKHIVAVTERLAKENILVEEI